MHLRKSHSHLYTIHVHTCTAMTTFACVVHIINYTYTGEIDFALKRNSLQETCAANVTLFLRPEQQSAVLPVAAEHVRANTRTRLGMGKLATLIYST